MQYYKANVYVGDRADGHYIMFEATPEVLFIDPRLSTFDVLVSLTTHVGLDYSEVDVVQTLGPPFQYRDQLHGIQYVPWINNL